MCNSQASLFDIAFPDTLSAAFESELSLKLGADLVGIDEAGRGPWAGPVVIAAACLDYTQLPNGLNDSKKLNEATREALYGEILAKAQVSICVQSAQTIDQLNIREATLQGMTKCYLRLASKKTHAFIDGRDVPSGITGPAQALVKGDGRCLAIAAASIVAKVTRDRLMKKAEAHFPGYGFAQHKGYGTKLHQAALATLGPCALHRRSFRPIHALLDP
ncbi:ribonuclease HII [Polycladidibacter hongkongensis]|uniref:ribonuclease HII n=1 Tax=Polycladidibacter hongkongensis TaxID=1647556 RepID=UPI0008357BDE|nr:ribonuclease HII [Pseudovibrio hongkongensis]